MPKLLGLCNQKENMSPKCPVQTRATANAHSLPLLTDSFPLSSFPYQLPTYGSAVTASFSMKITIFHYIPMKRHYIPLSACVFRVSCVDPLITLTLSFLGGEGGGWGVGDKCFRNRDQRLPRVTAAVSTGPINAHGRKFPSTMKRNIWQKGDP